MNLNKCPLFLQPKTYISLLKHFYLILLLLFIFNWAFAQQADTTLPAKDSILLPIRDSVSVSVVQPMVSPLDELLATNRYLNSKGTPVSLTVRTKKVNDQDPLFYLLAGLIFFFGIIRTIYARYFSTLFRVFFNSSLRQSQLTDQLQQSNLPSLFFNLIFLMAGGFYVYFLLQRLSTDEYGINWILLGSCVAIFMIIYLVKFLTLKFVGWVTGYKQEADTYIFIIFLINKIIGICLLPVIVILSFSPSSIVNIVIIISYLLIGVMLLLRFFRSYGLLQHKLKVSRFHFFLYIFSVEILPLMLIYKAVNVFIVKML